MNNDWIELTIDNLPPVSNYFGEFIIQVKTLGKYTNIVNEYETYFLSELERNHILYKWCVTHWRLKINLDTI